MKCFSVQELLDDSTPPVQELISLSGMIKSSSSGLLYFVTQVGEIKRGIAISYPRLIPIVRRAGIQKGIPHGILESGEAIGTLVQKHGELLLEGIVYLKMKNIVILNEDNSAQSTG